MAFPPKTAELLAYRSGYICNNPDCNVLTVGPALSDPDLRSKAGEAAHIIGEGMGAARWEDMTAAAAGSADNGIWLCVSCHTIVDKNKGADYPKDVLLEWKRSHEDLIGVLLRTHRSPLPLLRRHSENMAVAQEMVEAVANRGVMFQPHAIEDRDAVIASIDGMRKDLQRCLRAIQLDQRLRDICNGLIHAAREVMNETSRDPAPLSAYVDVLRTRAAMYLSRLRREYGCSVAGPMAALLHS
ncbi:HNH endonuclease [Lysobacter sp. HA18]